MKLDTLRKRCPTCVVSKNTDNSSSVPLLPLRKVTRPRPSKRGFRGIHRPNSSSVSFSVIDPSNEIRSTNSTRANISIPRDVVERRLAARNVVSLICFRKMKSSYHCEKNRTSATPAMTRRSRFTIAPLEHKPCIHTPSLFFFEIGACIDNSLRTKKLGSSR